MLSTLGFVALVLAAPRADVVVAHVQADLASLGIAPGPVDGIDGPLTRAAVARFQISEGLPATGEIDLATRDGIANLIASLSKQIDVPRGEVAIDRPFVEETTDGD